jgi:tyrosyl-tRNA synthetase
VDLPGAARTERGIRVDKLLAAVGLAESVTEAVRKLKAGAVEINGEIYKDLLFPDVKSVLVVRLGKKWKRVRTN